MVEGGYSLLNGTLQPFLPYSKFAQLLGGCLRKTDYSCLNIKRDFEKSLHILQYNNQSQCLMSLKLVEEHEGKTSRFLPHRYFFFQEQQVLII